MKKVIKIVILAVFIIMLANFSHVQAIDDIFSQGQSFIDRGDKPVITEDEAIKQFVSIGKILVQVATVVLVVVGLILGIKYMLSGADEKAKIKEKLIWYVISIVLVYGAVGIFYTVKRIMENIF